MPDQQAILEDQSQTSEDVTSAEPTTGALATHARVYSLAEKYLIQGLKTVALQKFKSTLADSVDIGDYLEAAQEVYTSTIEDDRGLRDPIIETLYRNQDWLDREDVRAVIKGLGSLTYDLVIYTRQRDNIRGDYWGSL